MSVYRKNLRKLPSTIFGCLCVDFKKNAFFLKKNYFNEIMYN